MQVVHSTELGKDILYDSVAQKLVLNIDGEKVIRDANGKITVDASKLKVVSDDTGNVISIGVDKGAFIKADKIKEIVGEMVASATDGIDYDALGKTLIAKIKALAVVDGKTIDFTLTDTDGNESITAEVIKAADKAAGGINEGANKISIENDGLYVGASKVVSTLDQTIGAEKLSIGVDDSAATVYQLELITDLAGNNPFYGFKKV